MRLVFNSLLFFFVFFPTSKAADLLVVAAEHHMLQYQENGINKGTTIEMLTAILSASNLTGDVEYMPWARAFDIAQNQADTLVLSLIRTPQREDDFYWLLKVSESARVFISLASRPENKILNEAEAKNKSIAIVRGSLGHQELLRKNFSEDKNIYLVSSHEKMFSLFFNNRVDLIYTDPNTVQAHLNHHHDRNIPIDYTVITPNQRHDSYIATNKKISPHLLDQLKVAIIDFKSTPQYQYLLRKE